MTVYRKLLKVKTAGSRAEGNLRPAFSDEFPNKYAGINYVVHEYNEAEGWCILEAWCSDHPILPPEHQKNISHLNELSRNPHVIEIVEKHPLSPPVLGMFATATHDSVDEEKKEIVVRGRKGKFIRKEKQMTHAGEKELYILDEG